MSTATDTFQSIEAYHNAIEARAREIWRHRGRPVGEDVDIWLEAERDLVGRGLIPAAPPAARRSTTRRTKTAADEIDERALSDRLDRIGGPGSRSATSV